MSEQTSSACEQCQQRYNLFRRRKQCDLCGQIFCAKCAPKSRLNNSRACSICLVIINERTTRDQLSTIRIRHLRAYLIHSKILSRNRLELLIEKQDLIHAIESNKRRMPHRTYVRSGQMNTNLDETETVDVIQEPEMINNETEQATTVVLPSELIEEIVIPPASIVPNFNRIALSEISSFESIHDLSVRQLKDILQQNFVSTKGCVEKDELISKVQLLYRDQQQQNESNTTACSGLSDDNLCKVCMDANIDCVFLDCGHLCTCVQCGKRLSECPLCRSYIIRVVRVFKS